MAFLPLVTCVAPLREPRPLLASKRTSRRPHLVDDGLLRAVKAGEVGLERRELEGLLHLHGVLSTRVARYAHTKGMRPSP